MCLAVVNLDLGAADALLDYAEGLLVLRSTLTPAEQCKAARRILAGAGVEQAGSCATCYCGEPLRVAGCDERTMRRHTVRSLAATSAAALIVAGVFALESPAAADDPFEVPSWSATVDRFGLECRYGDDTARCSSRALGPVHVTVEPSALGESRYTLESSADDLFLRRFHTAEGRDEWVAEYHDAVPLGERGALYSPTGTP